MKSHIRNTDNSDQQEQAILAEWEKVTNRITSRTGVEVNPREVIRDWRKLATLANKYADLVEDVWRGRK